MDIRAFISSVDTPLWVIIIGSILFGSILAKVSLSLISVIKLVSAPSYVKLIRNSLSRPLYFFYPLLLLTVSMGFYINGHPDSRSEEHTSELQSRENLVCRLLLEKKKQ